MWQLHDRAPLWVPHIPLQCSSKWRELPGIMVRTPCQAPPGGFPSLMSAQITNRVSFEANQEKGKAMETTRERKQNAFLLSRKVRSYNLLKMRHFTLDVIIAAVRTFRVLQFPLTAQTLQSAMLRVTGVFLPQVTFHRYILCLCAHNYKKLEPGKKRVNMQVTAIC